MNITKVKTVIPVLAASVLLSSSLSAFVVTDGTTSVNLDLSAVDWSISSANATATAATGFAVGFDILPSSTFDYDTGPVVNSGVIAHSGTVTLQYDGSGPLTTPVGTFNNGDLLEVGEFDITSALTVDDTFATTGTALFDASPTSGPTVSASGDLDLAGDLLANDTLSQVLLGTGDTSISGADVGDFQIAAVPEPSTYVAILGLAAAALVIARRRNRA
jgi:hypothetical protein